MLLQQVNPHLSIKHMPEVSLGGLTVITGVNGAGKSHLLQAIETQNIRVTREDGMPLNLRRYDWTNMVPSNANQASGTMTSGLYQTILGQIEQQRNALNQNLINVLSAYQIDLEANVNLWKFCEMSDKDLKTAYGEGEEYDGFRDSVRGLSQQLTANVVANVGQNIPQRKCIDHIIKERKTLASVNQKYINTLPFFWEHGEPPRDCRRLQLLSRRSHYEQDNEQVFTGGSAAFDPDGFRSRAGLSFALGDGGFHC
jgi:hypothetical protein